MSQVYTVVPPAGHKLLGEYIAESPYFYRILSQIVEQIQQLVGMELCGLILYDPRTNELRLQRPGIGYSQEVFDVYRLPVDAACITTRVFHSGKPYHSEDLPNDPATKLSINRVTGAKNAILVPLELDGVRIGVFHLANKAGGFTEQDMRLANLLSYHLSILLENMRLLETEREQREVLRRTLSIHDDLTRMVLDGEGLEASCSTLSRLLASRVLLVDRFGRLMCDSTPNDDVATDEGWQHVVQDGGIPEVVRSHAKIRESASLLRCDRRPTRIAPIPEIGFRLPRVVAPVVVGREILAFIWILESTRPLDDHDTIAVEQAGIAMALQMMKERAAAEAQYKLVADFVGELISGNYGTDDIVMRRAGYLEIDLRLPRVVMIVATSERDRHKDGHDEHKTIATRARAFDVITRVCRESQIDAVVCQRSSETIILAEVGGAGSSARRALLRLGDVFREQTRLWVPELSLVVGLGGRCAMPSAYANSYQQARRAIDFARASRRSDCTVSFDQLSVFGTMLAEQARDRLAPVAYETLGALIDYDRRRGKGLVGTLDQYLMHAGHVEAAAAAMYLHPSTLRYRLARIEELLGVDLHDVDTRFNLQLALKVLRTVEC